MTTPEARQPTIIDMVDRLDRLVGPAEIRHPDTVEISRDELRKLLRITRSARQLVRRDLSIGEVAAVERELIAELADAWTTGKDV